MQAIADHVYHILIIAFVAATIVEAIVKVDEILPSEVVGFVRGFTRLGPRTGEADGLRWLPAEAMELGERPLWNTFRVLRDISSVAPRTSPIGEALRASDYHAFACVVSRREDGWKDTCAHLRVLDCAGLTYQVGDARADRRGHGRPSRQRNPRRRPSVAEEAAVGDDRQAVEPDLPESPDREPEPLAGTDLAVVPIDPREVLWAVGRMIEL